MGFQTYPMVYSSYEQNLRKRERMVIFPLANLGEKIIDILTLVNLLTWIRSCLMKNNLLLVGI
jgi:hypothetical protein